MDKVYKTDIPAYKRVLEQLKREFDGVVAKTNWVSLRIDPLLDHVNALERVLLLPEFSGEKARLRRGVAMFHADLVYLRANIKALKEILVIERRGAGVVRRVRTKRQPAQSARRTAAGGRG